MNRPSAVAGRSIRERAESVLTGPARTGAAERERERARRRRVIRRQRLMAFGLFVIVATATGLTFAMARGGARSHGRASRTTSPTDGGHHGVKAPPSSFAVGLRVLRLVDSSRTISLPDGTTEPRPLLTYVRYPALGSAGRTD